jgi:hypothetical protein
MQVLHPQLGQACFHYTAYLLVLVILLNAHIILHKNEIGRKKNFIYFYAGSCCIIKNLFLICINL